MAAPEEKFRLLMDGVLAGSHTAAAELLERYGPAVRQAVRRRLNKEIRSKFDSLDFVQDVWASFFAKPRGQGSFHDAQKLVAFLTRVARNKVVSAARQRLVGQKYNVNRECSLDNSTFGGPGQVAAEQPTPSEVVTGREQWDRLLDGQPLVYKRILVLLSEGRTHNEIAAEMSVHPRTVRRVIDKLLPRIST
jgi:RNA polymerase sigma factor (sigma-70 family)